MLLILFSFVIANRKIKAGEIIFKEKPTIVGPTTTVYNKTSVPLCVGCFGKLGKNPKNCLKCGIPVCQEKCADSEGHQLECSFLVNDSLENNLSILSPLRFLGIKKKDLKLYRKMQGLVSHREERVSYPKSDISIFQMLAFFRLMGTTRRV